jgi:hypothetical protein
MAEVRSTERELRRQLAALSDSVDQLRQRDVAMRRLLSLPTPKAVRADCEIRTDLSNYTKAKGTPVSKGEKRLAKARRGDCGA